MLKVISRSAFDLQTVLNTLVEMRRGLAIAGGVVLTVFGPAVAIGRFLRNHGLRRVPLLAGSLSNSAGSTSSTAASFPMISSPG